MEQRSSLRAVRLSVAVWPLLTALVLCSAVSGQILLGLRADNGTMLIVTRSNTSDYGTTPNGNRIVGGYPISVREAPWQAALIQRDVFICGASVISEIWVLTAAHCIEGKGPFLVRAGTRFFKSGGQVRAVSLIVVNGGYNKRSLTNDIAMMRVSRRFNFGPNLRPVRLAGANSKLPRRYTVNGWGLLNSNGRNPTVGLRKVRVQSVDRRSCQRRYNRYARITPKMLCAASPGRDACNYDSGGPLVGPGSVQFGIVSFGVGCAHSQFPGVYTDVRSQSKWIQMVSRRFARVR